MLGHLETTRFPQLIHCLRKIFSAYSSWRWHWGRSWEGWCWWRAWRNRRRRRPHRWFGGGEWRIWCGQRRLWRGSGVSCARSRNAQWGWPAKWHRHHARDNFPSQTPHEKKRHGTLRVWGSVSKVASASSSLDFWVKSFQLHAGIFDAELPIDTALFGVRLVGPGSDFRVQFGQFTDATSTACIGSSGSSARIPRHAASCRVSGCSKI